MSSDPAQMVAFYRRYLATCNEHRFDQLDQFVAADVNGPTEGRARYIEGLQHVVAAFPDYHWELLTILVDGDHLAVRLRASGTHSGSAFRGVAATNRHIVTQELVIYQVQGGQIRRCWGDLGTTVRDALVSGSEDV